MWADIFFAGQRLLRSGIGWLLKNEKSILHIHRRRIGKRTAFPGFQLYPEVMEYQFLSDGYFFGEHDWLFFDRRAYILFHKSR